jgi:hypothetical protein
MQSLYDTLALQWTKRDGTPDEKMIDHCIKNIIWVDMGDYYLEAMNKPGIDSTIYYADEDYTTGEMAEDPGTDWQVFKRYNLRHHSPENDLKFINEDRQEVVIYTKYCQDKTGGTLKGWTTKRGYEELIETDKKRLATPEEVKAIVETLEEQTRLYEKRLENYYKRYGKKVRTSSYWANR